MSEAYPNEVRDLAGPDVAEGVRAPGAPLDPEELAEQEGSGADPVAPIPGTSMGKGPEVTDNPEEREHGESIEGYLVDLACLRRYPREEYSDRAAAHTTDCALMGHCVESGYAVVDEHNAATPLDDSATPYIVTALKETKERQGVRLGVDRTFVGDEMRTQSVWVVGDGAARR